MKSRLQIAFDEHQNPSYYSQYYSDSATLRQAIVYIAFGLIPMQEKWQSVMRSTVDYTSEPLQGCRDLCSEAEVVTQRNGGQNRCLWRGWGWVTLNCSNMIIATGSTYSRIIRIA